MKKLSFFLMAMLFTCATTLQAAEVTETIAMKGFGGLTTSSYENVTKTGTSDLGTEMVAYAFNPSTGQVRGNKTTIAGASVTSADANKNWSLYNTQAMPGAIKSIKVTQTATGTNKFQNKLYVALGTTNQGAVTTVTGAKENTTGTATEFTFDNIDETQGYTYFKLLSNVKFTSNSVAGVVVTVTYVTGNEDPDATMYTVTTKVNDETMGTVTGAGEYAEGKTATLTANPNTGYKFVNWSNGETANPLKLTVTENVEITANFAAIPPMTCAEAAATASGETVVLNPFDVVYVVKDAGYIYIKDESGFNLIYDFNLDDKLKAGDHVEGFVGVSSPYNGLPELKASVSYNELTVTSGVAPEPTVMAAAPTKAELNQYVKFENVTLTASTTFSTGSATNATMVVNGTNVTLRNNFKLAATLEADKAYDIVGFVAIYNSTIQVYYLSAEEYVAPVVNHTITVFANPAEAGTVTGGGEFEETDEITVKAVANEGYEFVNWTEGETVVSTNAEYTFTVTADVALVANFKESEPVIEWIEMELEIANLTTEVMEVGDKKYLQLNGRNDMEDADVTLFLNDYADADGDYVVNTETAYLTYGGLELTVLEGVMTQTTDVEKGAIYTGTVRASVTDEEEGGTMYLEFALTMYAAPAVELVLTDAIVAFDEKTGVLTFNVSTGEGEGYYVELANYTAPGVHEGPQICLFETPEVVAYTNYAETSVADGVITLKGEFTSFMGDKFDLTISGKLPVAEEPVELVGVVKRALQIGESTIILTHEADGTAHIYNVVDEEISELSQEGVVAVDPENAGDLLAISDIALTEDGKLLAINKIVCQAGDGQVDAGYKRGETRVYIWNDLAGAPSVWFTSKMSSNWYRSVQGHTMAYKGTSINGTLFTTGVTATGTKFRYSVYNVIDGVYTDPAVNDSEYYHYTKGSAQETTNVGANYELNVSPLAANTWVLDGELINPFEITDPLTYNTEVTAGATLNEDLGKKYNGASYVTVGEQVLMVAPYAAEDKLAGVKVLDITSGLATATVVATADLDAAVEATAAATAVAVAENVLTITLVGDATIHLLDVELEKGPATALENIAVEGKAVKAIINGQLVIIKNGVQYNAQGQVVK